MGITYESRNFTLTRSDEVLHVFRRDLIKATVKYLKSDLVDIYDHEKNLMRIKSMSREEKREFIPIIEKVVSILSSVVEKNKIDYSLLEESYPVLQTLLPFFALSGLLCLLIHGYETTFLSIGESIDISWTYFVVEPFMDHYTKSWQILKSMRRLCKDCIYSGDCGPIKIYSSPDYQE